MRSDVSLDVCVCICIYMFVYAALISGTDVLLIHAGTVKIELCILMVLLFCPTFKRWSRGEKNFISLADWAHRQPEDHDSQLIFGFASEKKNKGSERRGRAEQQQRGAEGEEWKWREGGGRAERAAGGRRKSHRRRRPQEGGRPQISRISEKKQIICRRRLDEEQLKSIRRSRRWRLKSSATFSCCCWSDHTSPW